jgi:hypothetical protein
LYLGYSSSTAGTTGARAWNCRTCGGTQRSHAAGLLQR